MENGSDEGKKALAKLEAENNKSLEEEEEENADVSPSKNGFWAADSSSDSETHFDSSSEEEVLSEDDYEFDTKDFSIEKLISHIEGSMETPEDRFAVFFQKVPFEKCLELPQKCLDKEHRKFVGALDRLQKANPKDSRIASVYDLVEKIYNLAVKDLQQAQSIEDQQEEPRQQELLEPRKSARKQTKTMKGQALEAEKAEKAEKLPRGRRTRSLPTRSAARDRIERKRNQNRVEMYDAKGNPITGDKLEEAIKKKSKTASYDAQGNLIPPPPPPLPTDDQKLPAVEDPPLPTDDQKLPAVEDQKPPAVEKKKSIVTKNGKLKRSVFSRPTGIGCVKDRTVRDKIKICAKNIKQLQYCSTFEDPALQKYHPKSEHSMFCYDELKQKPHYEALPKRPEPVFVFLPPEGFDVKAFGKRLQRVGKEMAKASGKGYLIAKDEDDYTELLCGPKKQFKQKKAKDKNVADL